MQATANNTPIACTLENIATLVREEIARLAKISIEEIDLELTLDDYTLDSIKIVKLAAALGNALSIELEPTLLNEYVNLNAMIRQLEVLHSKQINKLLQESKKDITLNIIASFTAEPVEESLRYWLNKLAYRAKIEFAPYNQLFQQLLNPQSLLFNANVGVNIILFRIEDWFRFEKAAVNETKVAETVQSFLTILQQAANKSSAPIIIGLCPHSPNTVRKLGLSQQLNALDEQILATVANIPNVYLADLRNLAQDYKVRKTIDEARDQLGHIPFTQEYYAAMGTALTRKAFSLLRPAYKVIVLDCDNTLWQGICGEDGHLGVNVTPAFAELQKLMLTQQEQGLLLCLCSKNNEADVWQVFSENPGMILRRQHIVAHQINWQRKSKNITALAKELNLGLDSFIFIDDNPAECAEVQDSLPQVLVIHLPERQHDIANYLKHHWAFEFGKVTKEDQARTQLYLQNKQREELRTEITDFTDFLQQLNIEIVIQKLLATDLVRASQLTHRTNQFNATTIRRSENEIQQLLQKNNYHVMSIKVKDKFGDYGFVGLMIAKEDNKTLICETFLMSCRVLGRQVEQQMVRYLAKLAQEKNLTQIELLFKPSAKNKPFQDFYESLGGTSVPSAEGLFEIQFQPDHVEQLLVTSKTQHQLATKEEKLITKDNSEIQTQQINIQPILHEIASLQGDVEFVLRSIANLAKTKRPDLKTQFIAPRTAWQKKIAAIWCDILRMDQVGIYDNFYELGGDSLRAAEAFARMWDLGISDTISLQTIPEPTVAGLAQAIEDVKNGKQPTLLMDMFSLEDEGHVPNDIINEGYNIADYDQPMRQIFLTGATGFIGAFLLAELFAQTSIIATCLARAATEQEGFNRIKNNLQSHGLWQDNYTARINIVLGELAEPLFGLTQSDFNKLAEKIDTIFHCAAWVNFVYPYQHLKKANVDSVETIMRLAVSVKPRPIQLHFISTFGVIMSPGYKGQTIYEDQELAHCEGLLNGYEQSKYVGDKMIWKGLKERGIPANIYRPALVSGVGTSGVYHKLDEFLPAFLKGCIQLGSWPLVDCNWEMAPVDFVTKAIVHIARNPKNLGKAYFTLHPHAKNIKDYIQWHQDFGYPIRALPWDVWKKEFLNQGIDRLRNNALFPFVDFVRALSEAQAFFPATDKTNFLNAIKDLDYQCPDALQLLEKYTHYFIKSGYYQPPTDNILSINETLTTIPA
jgi:FkbH-like protein/thioester reductase-like protein